MRNVSGYDYEVIRVYQTGFSADSTQGGTAREIKIPMKKEEPEVENKDPFAAREEINKEKELVGGFKKTKDPSSQDLTLALAGLEVTTLPPAEATQSTHQRGRVRRGVRWDCVQQRAGDDWGDF